MERPTTSLAVQPSSTCRAPHVSMRFSPGGNVDACCANDDYPLGKIGVQTIGEIWHGAPIRELRSALDIGQYGLGCDDCGAEITTGNRSSTPATMYDRYPDGVAAWPKRLEFALSNTCNLQCIHCRGELSSAIRAQREHRPPLENPYDDAFFEELADYLPHLEVAVFIGGEPFLTRECRRVWDMLIERDLHPEVHVTTNGTIWDDRVEHYLRALEMRVAVSIDGHTAATNEAIRVGSDHAEVIRNRDRFRAVVAEYDGAFALNHCLLVQNWHELGDFLVDAESHGDLVHVIPVLYPAHDSLFCAEPPVLREIVDALETQRDAVADRLERNRASWLESIDHLRGHLARIEEGEIPVALRVRQVVNLPVALADAAVQLEALTGRPPVVVRARYETIEEVTIAPDWAGALAVEAWPGHRFEQLVDLVAHLGRPDPPDVAPGERGVTRAALRLRPDAGCTEVVLHSVMINQYAPEGWLLISASGPLPEPT